MVWEDYVVLHNGGRKRQIYRIENCVVCGKRSCQYYGICNAAKWGEEMITRIKEMHNLGRYENFIGNQEIGKQQIIFGFKGYRKSS